MPSSNMPVTIKLGDLTNIMNRLEVVIRQSNEQQQKIAELTAKVAELELTISKLSTKSIFWGLIKWT